MNAYRTAAACAALALVLLAGAARAEEPAAGEAATEGPQLRDIERAIAQAESRRSGAIGSFVVAGVLFVGGIVVSAVQTAENAEDAEAEAYRNGEYYYEYETEWAPFVVGTAVAVPMVIGGIRTLRDANRERRELMRQRRQLRLGATPAGTLVVGYSF